MSDTVTSHPEGGLPPHVAQVAEAMAHYPGHWALCGGWAVDAWLGRITREHGDVDISVLAGEQHLLYEQLRGWQLIAHDALEPGGGGSADVWTGRTVRVPGHLHGRIDRGAPPPPDGICKLEDGFVADIQINEADAGVWTLMRDPAVAVPLFHAVRTCPWGIPAVVPEVLLFYKAQDLRRRDRLDFLTMRPALAPEQRAWLHDALARCGHPWLAQLAEGAAPTAAGTP